MNKILFILIVLFVFNSNLAAQNTMLLVTGKKLNIGEFKLNESDYLVYQNKKGKTKTIAKQDVFSIHSENGKETVIYTPDLSDTAAFTVVQMRDYVHGVYDARTNYKTSWLTGTGIAIGGGSVGLTAAGMSTLFIPVFPVAYSAGVGIFKMKKEKLNLPENLKNNDYYTEGYLYRVNRKRMNHAILGTIIGMAAGTIAVIAFAK